MNWGLLVGAVLGLRVSQGLPVIDRELWSLAAAIVCGAVSVTPVVVFERSAWRLQSRLLALLVVLACWFLFFPEYAQPLYVPARRVVYDYGPALAFVWCVFNLLGRDMSSWPDFLRSLPVRCFFAPMMFGFLYDHIRAMPPAFSFSTPAALVASVTWWAFFVDLVVGAIGYTLPAAVFRAGLKGVDTSVPGLFFCLVCYPPFWATIDQRFLGHDDGYSWTDWLGASPLAWAWAALICVALAVYLGAVLSLGFRFSNLLYKGLCDAGLYVVCRHPQYLGKLAFYWLTAVPFVSRNGPLAALAGSLGMAAVTWVYYMRAVTEERFLAQFPEYADYAARVPALPCLGIFRFLNLGWVVQQFLPLWGKADRPG